MSKKRGSISDGDPTDAATTYAQSYPRKRVSLACDVCRLRKTRCDARRPACSFCSDLGIECVYTRPADAERVVSKGEDISDALQRIERIETALLSIAKAVGAQQQSDPFVVTPQAFRHEPITPSPASASIRMRHSCKMPNLLVFNAASKELGNWSYNYTQTFFDDQMNAMSEMHQALQTSQLEVDLSRAHVRKLQRTFADNVLKWLPLFDHETASSYLQYAQSSGHQYRDSSLCLVFLMYAIGSVSGESSAYPQSYDDLPGFGYYAKAYNLLDNFPSTSKDICALQCRVLCTIYHLYVLRPLQAWKMVSQASQDCIVLLKIHKDMTLLGRESLKRIYWICYVLENELETCLEIPSSGLRTYEAIVPLPTSHYEEEGMYYLLAFSSLRKLMVEVVDTVGLKCENPLFFNPQKVWTDKSATSVVAYAPTVALELRSQIDDWYKHLPSSLRFPLDSSLLFDTRKVHLRCQYYALIAVVCWPFVLQHSGNSLNEADSCTSEEESVRLAQAAGECLQASRDYLKAAEEILTQLSLASHLVIRGYFATAMILLLVFDGRDSQSESSLEDRQLLEQSIKNLMYWKIVPFMQPPLQEMERIARLKGLVIDG